MTLFNTEILDTVYLLTYAVDIHVCMRDVILTQDDADETLQWSSNAETECEDLESGGEEYQPRGRNAQRQAQLLREYQLHILFMQPGHTETTTQHDTLYIVLT